MMVFYDKQLLDHHRLDITKISAYNYHWYKYELSLGNNRRVVYSYWHQIRPALTWAF